MIHGFKNSPLACEGIIGDGCGGGRWFFIEDEILKAYDPQTKDIMNLLADIKDAKEVSKKGCIITIKCEKELVKFDLSSMGKTAQ
jgi:hypothetical protein